MLRVRSVALLVIVSIGILLVSGWSARAQEKNAHGESKGHAAAKYEVEIHDPATGGTVTKELDLSKAEDKRTLEEALIEGHVHELRLKENPTISTLFSLA